MPIADVDERENLDAVVATAWSAFRRAGVLPPRVVPSVPILFFGDLDAYCASPTRVLTVGLNPSLHEFPKGSPFLRFPFAENITADQPQVYLDALCTYFRAESCPYSSWFGAYESLLNGLQASYYAGQQPSTALHTDIGSPVATDPTWRRLDRDARRALEKDGVPLWHDLLKVLKPQAVVISVAESYLQQVEFRPLSDWEVAHVFNQTSDGVPRTQPIKVWTRWHDVGGESSLFVFVRAAQTPLGLLGDCQKREAGVVVAKLLRSGP